MVTPWRPAFAALAAINCISLASRRKSNSLGTVSRISSRSCMPAQLQLTAQLVLCQSHERLQEAITSDTCDLCPGFNRPHQLGLLQSARSKWLHPAWRVVKRPHVLIATPSTVDLAAKGLIPLDTISGGKDQSVARRLHQRTCKTTHVPADVAV